MAWNKGKNALVDDAGGTRKLDAEEVLQAVFSAGKDALLTASPALSTEIDEGETYTYVGKAVPGTATGDAAWKVLRITNATGASRYADSGKFTQIWDNRASLTYA